MQLHHVDAPNDIIMVRPHHFRVNEETQIDNHFQAKQYGMSQIHNSAYQEISNAVSILQDHGICVHVFEDETSDTPDSVFPNNWFSTHPFGKLALFPMMAKNRRLERRNDIVEMIRRKYHVGLLLDYSGHEQQQKFLEGTGAMVIDHQSKSIYAVRSQRCNEDLFLQFCETLNYIPIMFDAEDQAGRPIYHTNVLMCIANKFALISLSMIKDPKQRNFVVKNLQHNGREIIDLSELQIQNFAGNALELRGNDGDLLVMSQSAYDSLRDDQIQTIEKYNKIVAIDIPTIELAGGSIRCAMASLHLSRRK